MKKRESTLPEGMRHIGFNAPLALAEELEAQKRKLEAMNGYNMTMSQTVIALLTKAIEGAK